MTKKQIEQHLTDILKSVAPLKVFSTPVVLIDPNTPLCNVLYHIHTKIKMDNQITHGGRYVNQSYKCDAYDVTIHVKDITKSFTILVND